MKIDLKQYFEERDRMKGQPLADGPVVTLSREYGCEANRIARMLQHEIGELLPGPVKTQAWQVVSKEILEESARDLGLKPAEVDERILFHHADPITDLFAFTRHYTIGDEVILEKVRQTITEYANRGNVIIVGRGGSQVTREMKNALHIRLMAPLDWRVQGIAERRALPYAQALAFVKHMDENRTKWMEHLTGRPFDAGMFDLVVNVKTLTDRQIVEMILHLMQQRGMVSAVREDAVVA